MYLLFIAFCMHFCSIFFKDILMKIMKNKLDSISKVYSTIIKRKRKISDFQLANFHCVSINLVCNNYRGTAFSAWLRNVVNAQFSIKRHIMNENFCGGNYNSFIKLQKRWLMYKRLLRMECDKRGLCWRKKTRGNV